MDVERLKLSKFHLELPVDHGSLDLQPIIEEMLHYEKGYKIGLGQAAQIFLNKTIRKSINLRTSMWSKRLLEADQIKYAVGRLGHITTPSSNTARSWREGVEGFRGVICIEETTGTEERPEASVG